MIYDMVMVIMFGKKYMYIYVFSCIYLKFANDLCEKCSSFPFKSSTFT